ncbi:hypothetical protein [Rhizobium sp. G21]|uniref:hypothetical protein n=1 Tax=Rhizobium sp. G21 TaxID=2758439 RepID=UPI0016034F48|nr:hypothetical protein [Rhizobium sp. G21]MBB1248003.1 hypothetical protein [Rhizobium sp. G21]
MTKPLVLHDRPGLLIVWLLLLAGGFVVTGAYSLQALQRGMTPIPAIVFSIFTLVGCWFVLSRLLNRKKPALIADAAGLSYRGGERLAWGDVSELAARREMRITYLRLRYRPAKEPGAMRSLDICLSGLSLPPRDIIAALLTLKESATETTVA